MKVMGPRAIIVNRWERRKSARAMLKKERASSIAQKLGVHDWLRDLENLQLGRVLGSGSFGVVYRCTYDGDDAVAKELKLGGMSQSQVALFKNEVRLWAQVAHENIVEFRGVVFGDDSVSYLLLEHMPGGSLHARLESKRFSGAPPPTVAELSADTRQIASAMAHLHSRQIIHRDLKSDNVLIAGDGRLCVGDFGLARHCSSAKQECTAETGTYRFMAPEVMKHEEYGPPCDVYSFAIMCWSMFTYQQPFRELGPVKAAFAVATKGLRPSWPADTSRALVSICERCWHEEAARRPTFEQVGVMLGLLAPPSSGRATLAEARAAFARALPRTLPRLRRRRPSRGRDGDDSLDSSKHSDPGVTGKITLAANFSPQLLRRSRSPATNRKASPTRQLTGLSAAHVELLGGLQGQAGEEQPASDEVAAMRPNLARIARRPSPATSAMQAAMQAWSPHTRHTGGRRRRNHTSEW